ncbi:hypothetical protein EG359_02505 [Chryseobacterium joostei]|uniref:Uncharacterized protein n=1 Tax=Chryseobacterium joostei TaxID=112234 RepID=A0A1N7ILC0_9FLAO|nr:hypothetical protein [Chryseobacterium joostei]AZA98543.1 hypothetical protein EG359_02505 [Chryseobacterium joostei]SIS37865.1 hypothetical protein SAMN05421768_10621 [Chryseobacterium joostei]
MATYESVIKITGAVGDLVFYNLNGKNVVRKKSGFNKTAFKKNPSYEKVRQNSSEFGHCSKVGKIIRVSLDFYIKKAGDPLLYQKFAKLMTEIKDLDTVSERGKRTVENGLQTEIGKKRLRQFQFGTIENVMSIVEVKNQALLINGKKQIDKAAILTIKLDSENMMTEYAEDEVILNESQKISFKEYFGKEDFLLYFVALKNENNEILQMGFI